ncbi:dienelactone hydrolase [Coprinopsis cinerea AmutBmut pab1-1]|nr:dienelactone hydrolase [Coprinopsis cinerea AmutBmut pab1-1]
MGTNPRPIQDASGAFKYPSSSTNNPQVFLGLPSPPLPLVACSSPTYLSQPVFFVTMAKFTITKLFVALLAVSSPLSTFAATIPSIPTLSVDKLLEVRQHGGGGGHGGGHGGPGHGGPGHGGPGHGGPGGGHHGHDHQPHDPHDPVLASAVDKDCLEGTEYEGIAKGWNVTIAGVHTYYVRPSGPPKPGPRKVLLFYSDVYSAFFPNNFILQDWYADQGYHVLGLDYFIGDPAQNQNLTTPQEIEDWVYWAKDRADPYVPAWNAAVRAIFPSNTKFVAVGYCFGAPYALEAAAAPDILASAFAQPAMLTEGHFYNVTQPLFASCAETDMTFPTSSRNRMMEILSEINAMHHLQVFSGTEHGFATRADLEDENAAWAKNTSAKSIAGWFNRFTS